MALFLSTFENKVDVKGRVSIPAPFRMTLNGQDFQGVVLYRSFTAPCIEGCDLERMENLSDAADRLETFSPEQEDMTALLFADARQLLFDGTGRIILPADLMRHANIKDKVAFIGRGKTFQIWKPELFEKTQKEIRERAGKKRPTLSMLGGKPHDKQ